MPYNPDRNELSAEKKSLVLVIILFVNLILISSQIVLKNKHSLLQTIIANMITPLQLTIQKSSDFVSSELYRYLFLRNAYKKYQLLKKQQIDLKIENYALKKQIRELNLPKGLQGKFAHFITATVIAVDVNFPYSSLMIDKGLHAGLAENDVVLNGDAELVGKIVEPLTAFSAAVRLITSSIGGAGAYIEDNMLEGLIKGSDGPDCRFHYLLAGKPVRLGAQVVTSGTDLIYPNYLPLGKVTQIESDYLAQKIVVRPYFVDKPLKKLVVLAHE
ncbi:MAG: rod shape-determining protein MreC [Candidatus Aminicenantes bacterium]|nr:rod shape-determining protein MreC [Candidatus Aminicenantes bacterium]